MKKNQKEYKYDLDVIYKHDVVFEKDVTVYGRMTVCNYEDRTIYKDKILKSKVDLLKALVGLS